MELIGESWKITNKSWHLSRAKPLNPPHHRGLGTLQLHNIAYYVRYSTLPPNSQQKNICFKHVVTVETTVESMQVDS